MKFPKQATAMAWSALGWNDYAATNNAIVTSNRGVTLRLSRWRRHLEEYIPIAFDHNFFYASGIEDCMLYTQGKLVTVADMHKFCDGTLRQLLCPLPCDWCGKPVEETSLLCNAGLLAHNFCSQNCAAMKLSAIIRSDICLSDMFSKPPYRKCVEIPEDEELFPEHFSQVPAFGIFDRFDQEVYVVEKKKAQAPVFSID